MAMFFTHCPGTLKAGIPRASTLNLDRFLPLPEAERRGRRSSPEVFPVDLGLGHTCCEKLASKEAGERRAFLRGDGLRRLETCCRPI
jgi:hypothetical protein